jgi:UDP-N-acetylglucosamine acyltransferase
MPNVSPHAIIDPAAEVAADAVIGPFSYVGPGVRIEGECVIDNNVTLVGRTTLGRGTRVYPLAVIGSAGADGQVGGQCRLGEGNAVREHVTICGGTDRPTRIGNHNLIMIACQIGAGATIGNFGIFDNCTHLGDGAVIEDYVRMSGFASVAAGVRVGAYSFLASYAGLEHDAPPYAMLQGYPVRVRGVNSRNLKACGFSEDDIHDLKAAFRKLFGSRGTGVNAQAMARIEAGQDSTEHVGKLLAALRAGAGEAKRSPDA